MVAVGDRVIVAVDYSPDAVVEVHSGVNGGLLLPLLDEDQVSGLAIVGSLGNIDIGEVVAVVLHILLQVIQRTVAHRGSLIGALVVLQVIGGQNIDGLVVHSQLLLVGVVQGEAAGANGLHGVEVIVDTIVGVSLLDAIGVGAEVCHGGDDAVAVVVSTA